jgi:hypothetical protein
MRFQHDESVEMQMPPMVPMVGAGGEAESGLREPDRPAELRGISKLSGLIWSIMVVVRAGLA